MKTILLIPSFFLVISIGLSQNQPNFESSYQLGMLGATSAKESFSYSQDFNALSWQFSTLPLFAKQFKVISSIGLSGQFTFGKTQFGKLYSYVGVQQVQNELENKSKCVNLGAGFGFKTKINQVLEFVCQGGYNTLTVLKQNRRTIFNSEVGMRFSF